MKKALYLLTACLINIHILTASSLFITDLRCESLTDPLGIDTTLPHFSWKIRSTNPVQPQYYEIQVASDSIRLIQSNPDLWNSGKTRRPASVMIPYEGKELRSRMLCYWRVRIWNEKGEASDWSPIGRFAVGILENDKLQGAYIGLATGHGDVRAPLLRKTFTMRQSGTTFLHVSSLGYHEAYINGIKADSRVLAPVTSQLDKRSLIVTYDITPYLQQGENEILLWLGQGWYKKQPSEPIMTALW